MVSITLEDRERQRDSAAYIEMNECREIEQLAVELGLGRTGFQVISRVATVKIRTSC